MNPTEWLVHRRQTVGGNCADVGVAFVKEFPEAELFVVYIWAAEPHAPGHVIIRYRKHYYDLDYPNGASDMRNLIVWRYGRLAVFSEVKKSTPEQVMQEWASGTFK